MLSKLRKAAPLLALMILLAPVALWAQDNGGSTPPPLDLTAKVILIAGMVFTVLQGIKKLFPAIGGTGAKVLNAIMAAALAFSTAPAGTAVLSWQFIISVVVPAVLAAIGAMGIHDALRRPSAG